MLNVECAEMGECRGQSSQVKLKEKLGPEERVNQRGTQAAHVPHLQ